MDRVDESNCGSVLRFEIRRALIRERRVKASTIVEGLEVIGERDVRSRAGEPRALGSYFRERGLPVEAGQVGIHAISAAAIDRINIAAGEERPVRIEIEMNNSAGIFQVDDLLATKLRGTPLEGHIEVIAQVSGETEKRLLPSFRL